MRNLQKKKNVHVAIWYANGRKVADYHCDCELSAKRFTEKILAEKTSKLYIVIRDDSNELFRGYANRKVLV